MTSRDTGALTRLLLCFLTVAALVGGLGSPASAADPSKGTIKGTITVPAGFDPIDIRVRAHPEGGDDFDDIEGYTEPSGAYTFDLPAGRYKLEFDYMDGLGDILQDEWYPDKRTEAQGQWVTVTAGGTQTINADIARSTDLGTIKGTVTWPNGAPTNGIAVYLHKPNDRGGWNSYFQWTDDDGKFEFGLHPGPYFISYEPFHGYLKSEYWPNQTSPEDASQITVSTGSNFVADAVLACNGPCATAAVSVPEGGPAVGQTLTATSENWTLGASEPPNPPNYVMHEWFRDGTRIEGATAPTYTATTDDLGHRISVRLTEVEYTPLYPVKTVSFRSPRTSPVANGTLNPGTPTISGTAAVGSTLTATPGTWAPAGVSHSFQWLRDGVEIDGATAATYTATAADASKTLSVRVTGTLLGHDAASRTSTGVVVAAQVVTGANPRISGTARLGRVLTAATSWTPSTATTTYQWLRNGAPIARATGRTYTLTRSDVGRTISVRVVGSRPDHASATRTSSGVKIAPAVSAIAVKAKGGKRTAVFSVRVSATGVQPTGVVRVKLGSRTVKSAKLKNGRAVLKGTRLPKGKRTFTVSYLGRDGVAGSTVRAKVTIR